jgi:hypothetical protein
MNQCRAANLATAVTGFAFFGAGNARSDEVLSFHVVTHATSVQFQQVGDVDGHTLGLARQSGLALFSDGSVGTTYFTAINDYTNDAGTYVAYYSLILNDGSVLWFKVAGSAKPNDTTIVFPEVPVVVLRGNGRFEGIKGNGTFKGQRVTPLAVGADLYADVVINLRK